MAITPEATGGLGGIYDPKRDRIWASVGGEDQSSPTHEAIHRGIRKLRDAGHKLEKSDEEYMVRAMMQKFYGDVELEGGEPLGESSDEEGGRRQMAVAKENYRDNPRFRNRLNELEKAAAEEVRKKRPYGGPR